MHVGALLAAPLPEPPLDVPERPCALKVESCCVLRALPHFGQAIFSLLESTSFS